VLSTLHMAVGSPFFVCSCLFLSVHDCYCLLLLVLIHKYITFFLIVKVEVREEFKLYGFSNFVADVGGSLGLLLGASLLSIFDCWVEFLDARLFSNKKITLTEKNGIF
jgi:hypothetical protein